MQDPELYAAKAVMSLPGAVTPETPAFISPGTRTIVNGHYFWVSGPAERAAFRSAPHRYTGPLLDPVTHEWFSPDRSSPRIDTDEGILLFRDDQTRRRWEAAGRPAVHHVH